MPPYQTTLLVIIIMASERDVKKFSKGFPFGPNLPRVIPSTVAKTTRPIKFIPDTKLIEMGQFSIANTIIIKNYNEMFSYISQNSKYKLNWI